MDKIIEFATDNYLVFAIVCGFLILALIGYTVENRSKRDIKIKHKKVKIKNKKIKASKDAPIINQPEPKKEATPLENGENPPVLQANNTSVQVESKSANQPVSNTEPSPESQAITPPIIPEVNLDNNPKQPINQ